MSHEYQDRVSLELAERVASGLSDHPEWIVLARDNLDRWSRLNADAASLLRCYDEWRELLELPAAEIVAILRARTDVGQRLRQNSPFAGVLTPREVWEIKQRHRHDSNAA